MVVVSVTTNLISGAFSPVFDRERTFLKTSELIRFFILAMKDKYPNVFSPSRYELVTPTQFVDQEMQKRWLGFQLCYENLGNIDNQPTTPVEAVHEYRTVYDGELKALVHKNVVTLFYIPKDEHGRKWIYKPEGTTLKRATILIKNLIYGSRIDLNQWQVFEDTVEQNYLIGLVEGRKSHIWDGNDTYCKSWSQNGLKQANYKLSNHAPASKAVICTNCLNNLPRGLKIQLPPD
jgi:hypothetical protein